MDAQITAAGPILAEINRLETQLMVQRSQRDALNDDLWDKIKRVRSTVKGIYGDDSMKYEMVGGTRVSDRKPNTHRVSNGA
ncbi:MAG: hypothetical protein NT121_03120 [Chloroflexi bacterium]|nr:hypothetical protein [Chloroflexota bacterium]